MDRDERKNFLSRKKEKRNYFGLAIPLFLTSASFDGCSGLRL